MRKYLIILAMAFICCSGCKKSSSPQPSNGAPSSAGSYLPVTSGSSWVYAVTSRYSSDTVTVKMNTTNATVDGKNYYTANSTSKHNGSAGIYFYEGNHIYTIHSFNVYADTILDLQIYNDTASVFKTWVSLPAPSGKIGNTPVRVESTISQKGLTKTFSGKTYTDVVAVTVNIEYDISGAGYYQDTSDYTYYLAKGVGIIAYTSTFLGEANEGEQIISSDVK